MIELIVAGIGIGIRGLLGVILHRTMSVRANSFAFLRHRAPTRIPQGVLERKILAITAEFSGIVAVDTLHMRSGIRVSMNASMRLPMASLVKLPIVAYALSLVDAAYLAGEQSICVGQDRIVPGGGVLRLLTSNGDVFVTISTLIDLMITVSDNTASDIVLAAIGGTGGMQKFIERLGSLEMSVDRSIQEVISDFDRNMQEFLRAVRDTATVENVTDFLAALCSGTVLSEESTRRIVSAMQRCETGTGRLAGLLGSGAKVYHKTPLCQDSCRMIAVLTL